MEELVQDEKRERGERCQIGDGGGKGGRRVKNPLKIFLNANLFCPFRFRHRFIFQCNRRRRSSGKLFLRGRPAVS